MPIATRKCEQCGEESIILPLDGNDTICYRCKSDPNPRQNDVQAVFGGSVQTLQARACPGADMDERIKESKDALRKRLAALPIAEKLRIVEQLAERQKLIQSATDIKSETTQPE